jgi:hypothetical protein
MKEKSKCAGLAQQNGFQPSVFEHSLVGLVKGTAKYDNTLAT